MLTLADFECPPLANVRTDHGIYLGRLAPLQMDTWEIAASILSCFFGATMRMDGSPSPGAGILGALVLAAPIIWIGGLDPHPYPGRCSSLHTRHLLPERRCAWPKSTMSPYVARDSHGRVHRSREAK